MEEWFGMTPTGRQLREPTATLHEAEDADGIRHTILAFDTAYRGHPALNRGIKLVESFLEHPMVVGLVELKAWDPESSRFAYPTGFFWTLKDLFRIYADQSMTLGIRAGLELGYLVGQILVEAAENGATQGCFAHGGLSPWRVGLRTEGDLIVFGYGLPQMDLASHVLDPNFAVSPDSVRYAPPERLTGQPEGIASDTASVVALAYEAITGQPLYAGHDLEQLTRSVSLSEAATVLSRPNNLPRPVATLFAQSLIFDPDSRLTGQAWLAQMADLHAQFQQGESLAEVAHRMRGLTNEVVRRPARLVSTEAAEQISAPRRREEQASAPPAASEAPKPETRWSRPTRRRAESPPPEPEPISTGTTEATRRRRRLRGEDAPLSDAAPMDGGVDALSSSSDGLEGDSDPGDSDAPDGEAAPGEGSQRLRRRADVSGDSQPMRRRRRRDEPVG